MKKLEVLEQQEGETKLVVSFPGTSSGASFVALLPALLLVLPPVGGPHGGAIKHHFSGEYFACSP